MSQHQPERFDNSTRQIASESHHVYQAAYTGDMTQAHSGGVPHNRVSDHGFPSESQALLALGLAAHDAPVSRARKPGGVELPKASDAGRTRIAQSGIDRDRDPNVSENVSDAVADQWGEKFNQAFNKPNATPISVLNDLTKEAAAAGTNADGSPKVSINAVRDQWGERHYYAMFNQNWDQAKLNQKAVQQGKVNLSGANGTKASIAEIGWDRGADGSLV
jgi:hypothetical protein